VAAPRISVVLPTYNRSSLIRPTLASVITQSCPDWELLVVSDGSTDDTDQIVRSHAVGDDRIRHIAVPRSGHPGVARTIGLDQARAPVVAYLDHDDTYEPDHLAVVLDLIDRGADVVATGCRRVDPSGRPVGQSTPLDLVWSPELQVLAPLFEPTRVAHRRATGVAVGGWPTAERGLEDWGMWLRLTHAGARFATTSQHTCSLELSPTSRRHGLGIRFALVLGRYPDRAAASRALARLHDAGVAAALHDVQRRERAAWYADQATAGTLVLPAGLGLDGIPALLAAVPIENEAGFTTVVPQPGGGAVLAQPLLCCDPDHAGRVRRTLERRFPATLGELRRVLAEAPAAA
jgi:hypothetical protein